MTARTSASRLLVPITPSALNEATSKKYVDDQIALAVGGGSAITIASVDGLQDALDGKIDKSLIDTKGDIVIGTGANTPGIRTVGIDGQVLKADSGDGSGLSWLTLDKTVVGLANVDNTSDATKLAAAGTLAAKTIDNTNTIRAKDSAFTVEDDGDSSKKVAFQVSGVTAGQTRTLTVPDVSGTLYVSGGTDVPVADGGSGRSSHTTYTPIVGGTTTTGAQQSVASAGSAGQFLRSAGASALPTYATPAITEISGLQAALDLKAPLASPAFTGTPTGITKAHVGLGNVDNTSDANKPISTATQTALDLKAPLASPTFTGTVSGVSKAMVGLGNADNTSDANKPVSTATQSALDLKADSSALTAHTGNTSNPHAVTKAQVGLGSADNTADSAKNVLSATKLTTARNINGVAFDGTGDITVADGTKIPVLTATAVKTGNYTAAPFEAVICDVTSGGFNVTLPTAPADKTRIYVKRNDGSANVLTMVTGGSDVFNVAGGSTSQTLLLQNQGALWQYIASSAVWIQVTNVFPLAQLDTRFVRADSTAQTIVGKTIDSASNTLTGVTWAPEMVCTSAAVADGYNDMPGGISVEPGPNANGIYLDAIWLRVGDLATSNSGGDLICDIYGGTKNSQGSLISSITLTNGSQDVVSTLGSPYSLAANAVVRAYFTKGSSTVVKPLHVQLRGRYKG